MDAYKKTIQMRSSLLAIPALAAAALGVYDVFFASPALSESFIHGFQMGAATALGLLSMALILRYRLLLRDEKKLRQEYNRENDERYKAIRAKAGIPMILFTSSAMIAAGVVAGYFNETAFIVLLLAGISQLLFACIVKLICAARM